MKKDQSPVRALLYSIARNLALKGLALPLAFASSILLARLMGPDSYGQYALLFSVATVSASGIIRALSVLLVREVAGAMTLRQYKYVWGAVVVALLCVLPLIVLVWLADLLELTGGEGLPEYLLLIVSLLLAVSLLGPLLRGLHYTTSGLFVEQTVRPLFQCGFLFGVGVLLYQGQTQSLQFGIGSLVVGLLASCVIGCLLLGMAIRQVPLVKPEIHGEWFRASIPLLLVLGYTQGLSSQMPILLLGGYSESVEIANFRVADSIAGLISIALLAANVALGPRLAAMSATGDKQQFEHLLRVTSTIVALIALPMCFLFIATGQYVIPFFYGEEYRQAANLLWILCIAQVVNSFCGPVMLAMNMLKNEAYNLGVIFFSLVVAVLCGIVLVPNFGAAGAAYTALIGICVWNICLLLVLYRVEGINSLPYFKRVKLSW